jgi:hypothetical protein
MEFTLYYRGPLKANGGPRAKHALRLHFSQQLHHLWDQKLDRPDLFIRSLPDISKDSFSWMVGPLRVAALVTPGQVAEIDITMLRPEPPGSIVSRGGDIDNRVKTLLDGLRAPSTVDELPADLAKREDVVLCLLEDDKLITRLSVQTYQLLEPADSSVVVLLLNVRTKNLSDMEPYLPHRRR